jgi:hypothetical protein
MDVFTACPASPSARPFASPSWSEGIEKRGLLLESPARFPTPATDMMELNPVRQRIADLTGRLDALRGFL